MLLWFNLSLLRNWINKWEVSNQPISSMLARARKKTLFSYVTAAESIFSQDIKVALDSGGTFLIMQICFKPTESPTCLEEELSLKLCLIWLS